jgi:hypothetical protein
VSVAGVRAAWLASLEVAGTLPERTVVVRNEATAHAWRRDLVAAGRAELLVGTRFVTPLGAATAVLELAGITCTLAIGPRSIARCSPSLPRSSRSSRGAPRRWEQARRTI